MLFDYQMVTFEEIIKIDFFKWIQSIVHLKKSILRKPAIDYQQVTKTKIRFSTFSSGLLTEVSVIRNFAPPKFRKFCPTRPEGAEALSPGHRPGYSNS